MTTATRLDLSVVLPELDDVRDDCVRRLVNRLEASDGIEAAHVEGEGTEARLCLHYEPERVTLAAVEAIARSAGAELSARYHHLLIRFRVVATEDRGPAIEDALRRVPGVLAASVNFAAQSARVEFDTEVTNEKAILDALGRTGAALLDVEGPARPTEADIIRPRAPWAARFTELTWSLLSGALLAAAWGLDRATEGTPGWIVALYVGAYVLGGHDNVRHFAKDLAKGRFRLSIDLLMVIAAIGAAFLGKWAEGGLLLFLFSLGHALEHYALGRARGAIRALSEIAPQAATVLRNGNEVRLPIAEVVVGDTVVVKPAERVTVDGTVIEGDSAVDEAPVTGESVPADKTKGSRVFAGTVNGEGALLVSVTAASGDRTLDRVIRLVSEAETQKAPTQQFTEQFERRFVPAVLIAVVLLMVGMPATGLWTTETAIYRGLSVLIAAAPCALALGTPATVLAGIAQAARHGVLIKGGAHLEMLGQVDVIALDKTGTITEGRPRVTDLRPADGVPESELLRLSAAAERRSQHPLAKAIVDAAERRELSIPDVLSLESITGRGIRATLDGQVIEAGRELLFKGEPGGIPADIADSAAALERAGRTTVLVRATEAGGQGRWLGVIGLADTPRPGIDRTLSTLRRIGVRRVVMLTGDNEGVARAVAAEVGITDVQAELLPEDKVNALKRIAGQDVVAMVGDGVNDAPALAHAHVGIAMGGAGTAAALETADVALMSDDINRLPFALGVGRRARSIIRQNLAISLGVIAVLVIASVAGATGIGWAVVAHEGSTLVVIGNALRLLTYRPSPEAG